MFKLHRIFVVAASIHIGCSIATLAVAEAGQGNPPKITDAQALDRYTALQDKVQRAWGVRKLPWLILSDRDHIITDKGFDLEALGPGLKADGKATIKEVMTPQALDRAGKAPARTPAVPSAAELLDKYTKVIEEKRSFISKSEVFRREDCKFDAGFDPEHLGTAAAVDKQGLEQHQRVEFRTDGCRTRRILYMWGDIGLNSRYDEARPSYFLSNWDGESFYVHSSIANDPVRRGVIQLGGITKEQWETQFIRHSESWLLGYHGDERLDAMLRKAKSLTISEKMEDQLGSGCYVLKGDTGSGTITLWIDPEHGYNAAKIETVIRSGNPAYINKITTTTKLENVLFKKIDGVWVPMEADTLKQVDYNICGKKGCTREQSHHKRTQFLLNPDHNALGSFADPFKSDAHLLDETTVHKHGDPKAYVWRDGKVVLNERLQKQR